MLACKNNIHTQTDHTDTLWISGIKHECESINATHCLQIQNGDTPQLGLWNNWADTISNFNPEFGYMYKIKVLTSTLKKKNASPNNQLISYTLQEIIEKKPDPSIVLYDMWGLSSINGTELNYPIKRPRLEINLSNNTFLGNAFCNQISGEVHALNNSIKFSNIISTKMACKNLSYETTFLSILQNTLTYKSIKNHLIFYNNKGKEVLKFKKLD